MPGEPLMCVWQAVFSTDSSPDTGVTSIALKTVLDHLKGISNIHFLTSKFTEVFTQPKVKFADFLVYAHHNLRSPGVPMPLLINDIEKKCWGMAEDTYTSEALNREDLYKMWAIFNRLCVEDSYPPVICKKQTNYLFEKIAQNINKMWGRSNTILDGELTFQQVINDLDRTYFSATSTIVVRQCIEDIHSWLVREVMKTGILYKRTRKSANWTNWQKRWFVMSPGRLEYYHHDKKREKKGEVIIDTRSEVTSLSDYKALLKSLGNRFKVSNFPSLEIEMCAETEEEKEEWIQALINNITAMRNGISPQMQLLKQQQRFSNEKCSDCLLNTEQELNASEQIARTASLGNRKNAPNLQNTQSSECHLENTEDSDDRIKEHDPELFEVEKNKIKAVFVGIDKDGNGKIDREEFLAFIEGLGAHLDQREVNIIFDVIDKDKNQFILFDEFLEYFTRFLLGKLMDTKIESKLRVAFLKADRNGKGVINFGEFCEYAHSIRRSITIDNLMVAFEQLDAEGKGVIQFEDFRDFFRNEPAILERTASVRHSQSIEGCLKGVYESADTNKLASYLRERWVTFSSFKRVGVKGEVVMTGGHGIVNDFVPGCYTLLDLACFNDLPPIKPKHIAVKVEWIPSDIPNRSGKAVFPHDFDGVLPSEIATSNHLAYYGCSLADGNQLQVSLLYRHGIQDFTYENTYLEDYVTAEKPYIEAETAQGGAGMEHHEFSHLDCPLEEDSGFFVIGKFEDDNLLHLTGFKVPTRHTIYVPAGVIHCNDYMKGTWRTMLSDEVEVNHVLLVKSQKEDNGPQKQFVFSFK